MSQLRYRSEKLSGWGRFPVEPCHLYRPEKRSDVRAILGSGQESSYIGRGLGRSYGDAALNRDAGTICPIRLNRFISFDERTAVLECECGVSLAEIIEYFLPRGFFLPVTPGTKFVTVGGAIAADVHGKNHHRDGTISGFLLDFRLLVSSGEVLACSRSENCGAFWATVGGMGLTGFILSARIRLRPVESAYVRVDHQRTHNLDETLNVMAETDDGYQFSVAWLDCLARADSLGRAVLIRGNHARAGDVPHTRGSPLSLPPRHRLKIPFDLPAWALNRAAVAAFNALYYRGHGDAARQLIDLERFFYPLDAVGNWNRLYGKRGLAQYQVVVPENGGRQALAALLQKLGSSHCAAFLAVLKRFGEGNPGLLSFPMRGYTLAVDLPVSRALGPFLHELDTIVLDCGGRVYLAKDAVMRPETFAASYRKLDQFREVKQKLDPNGLLSSSQARRLRIAG
ncbi:MAG TPA: FAD-binding oxidoreductase [Terriglobia bacterium]|nr:FAD-binding oxidoreductase [Terriglobia bacterium]